jgi:hypothetical protein
MNRSTRNLLVLAALLGVWGWLAFFRAPAPAPPAARAPRPSAAPGARAPRSQEGELPRLKTELLPKGQPDYPAEVQGIFGSPPPPPPPPVKVAATPPPPAAPPPPPPPDPFQEEAKRLRYLGFLQDGQRMTAFIARGSEVFVAEAGRTFADRFKLAAVTEEAVLVTTPAGEKQVRVPLATPAAGGAPPPAPGGAPPPAPQPIPPPMPRRGSIGTTEGANP